MSNQQVKVGDTVTVEFWDNELATIKQVGVITNIDGYGICKVEFDCINQEDIEVLTT